ncbi:prepilin-type N-terminal cleavage/methylation domain-containing protein [Candidatus Peregrinibacteria bacterium]|nr:prepilin-type N-terminal cleavage/methylation domain-containing protein [Candidatus Peregrinibacteria bacterium]
MNHSKTHIIFLKLKAPRGFTLVELIIVIAIIAILAAAIFVAIDPARRLHEARNARRMTDIATLLDAMKSYQADNDGDLYAPVAALNPGNYYQIGTAVGSCDSDCAGQTTDQVCVDISGIGSNYLAQIPQDPKTGTPAMTRYALNPDTNGALTLLACDAEGEGAGGTDVAPLIQITR